MVLGKLISKQCIPSTVAPKHSHSQSVNRIEPSFGQLVNNVSFVDAYQRNQDQNLLGLEVRALKAHDWAQHLVTTKLCESRHPPHSGAWHWRRGGVCIVECPAPFTANTLVEPNWFGITVELEGHVLAVVGARALGDLPLNLQPPSRGLRVLNC